MKDWKNYVINGLATLIVNISDGIVDRPEIIAEKLRKIAFQIDNQSRKPNQ